jgi:hypothetical protein
MFLTTKDTKEFHKGHKILVPFVLPLCPLWLKILLILSLFPSGLAAQTLKGKIITENNVPVPHAAIYIRERSQGIAADDRGEFQTTLPQGHYTLEISSLGFEKQLYPVTVDKDLTAINIQMEAKSYILPALIVTNNKEDPAYSIMRKAIAKAPTTCIR